MTEEVAEEKQLEAPVAFIIFKRDKCARKAMECIRKVKPKKLYVIADGPREGRPKEAIQCANTRRTVESLIDWPCQVKKNYSETNLGCGTRIPSGLDWVFGQEEAAIIVEGDIVADPSFFHFCAEMLNRHRGDNAILQIGGYNRFNMSPPDGNYFFSRYCDIWGWATWRWAWQMFRDLDLDKWAEVKRSGLLRSKCMSEDEAKVRTRIMSDIMSGKLDAWGMRWEVARLLADGKGIVPGANLVKNIGFGKDASHTINPFNRHRLVRLESLPPQYVATSRNTHAQYDRRYHRAVFAMSYQMAIKDWLFYMLGKE